MHDLTADLPPPRDDEPASLRQDIVDELADHLECALHREQVASGGRPSASGGRESPDGGKSPDSSIRTAQHNVLTRFGNPAAVARRLWLDAMKETIMAQRLMTAASLVAAVAACVMVLFVWRSMDADRQVVMASLDANRDLISQLNTANTRLMDQLELSRQTLQELTAGGSQNVEWVQGEIQVRQGSEDGPPAAGVEVDFTSSRQAFGAPASDSEVPLPPIFLTTDKDGRADLGLVRFGYYQLRLKMPWDEYFFKNVTVHPGKPLSKIIVAPEPAVPIDVSVRIQWPDGFQHDDLWSVCWRNSLRRQLGGATWRPRDPTRSFPSSERRALIVNRDGQLGFSFDPRRGQKQKIKIGSESIEVMSLNIAEIQPINEFQLPDADYRFQSISFLIRVDGAVADVPRAADDQPLVTYLRYRDDASELFELTDGMPPQLTLTVPPEVIEKIREFRATLRAEEQAAANQT